MATKFKVWIDTPNTESGGNVLDYATYSSDTQRQNGFQSGQVASSVRVNTALRSATLVVAALMSALDSDGVYDASSGLSAVEQFVQQKWNSKANLYSPEFMGVPKAPTASDITNDTQIATTEFVHNVIDNATPKLARIVSGSYVGTGTYGQQNPTTISSDDLVTTPTILIINGNIYHWGNGSFVVRGSSASEIYTQTVNTSGSTVTKYSALVRRMVMQIDGSFHVRDESSTSGIFGTTSFYRSLTIANDELVNPEAVAVTTMGTFDSQYYYQPASDYTEQTLENIFKVSTYSGLDHLSKVEFYSTYPGNNTTLMSAMNGTRQEVADGMTGWSNTDYCYYSDIETTTVTVEGISWYYANASDAAQQLNANGVTYRWVAIS